MLKSRSHDHAASISTAPEIRSTFLKNAENNLCFVLSIYHSIVLDFESVKSLTVYEMNWVTANTR